MNNAEEARAAARRQMGGCGSCPDRTRCGYEPWSIETFCCPERYMIRKLQAAERCRKEETA